MKTDERTVCGKVEEEPEPKGETERVGGSGLERASVREDARSVRRGEFKEINATVEEDRVTGGREKEKELHERNTSSKGRERK